MIERKQYDIGLDSQRFSDILSQGASKEVIEKQKEYIEKQFQTDLGERFDRAESHYIYEIREGKLYGEGLNDAFEEVIDRGIIQNWDGSREESELIGFRYIQSYMTDEDTPEGALVFNPSPGDGENYQKNYLDVYKKVGNTVHTIRYFSDLTNQEYREKILMINPMYKDVIPEESNDTDFFLNPVVVPNHLDYNPDQLAEFVLGGNKGMDEEEFQRIWNDKNLVFLTTSIINTLVENPWAILELQEKQKAFYVGAKKVKDGGYMPTFDLPKMEIQYLASQKETIGGGGCGAGGCSINETSSGLTNQSDEHGSLSFKCPSCGEKNTRPYGQLIESCQGCGSDEVLPPSLMSGNSIQTTKPVQ